MIIHPCNFPSSIMSINNRTCSKTIASQNTKLIDVRKYLQQKDNQFGMLVASLNTNIDDGYTKVIL